MEAYLRLEPGLQVLDESGGEDAVGIALGLHVLQHLQQKSEERRREKFKQREKIGVQVEPGFVYCTIMPIRSNKY